MSDLLTQLADAERAVVASPADAHALAELRRVRAEIGRVDDPSDDTEVPSWEGVLCTACGEASTTEDFAAEHRSCIEGGTVTRWECPSCGRDQHPNRLVALRCMRSHGS